MNRIVRKPIHELGYHFISKNAIPKDKDEYYIREKQNKHLFPHETNYRHLTAREIETLVQNNNASDDWNKILVTDAFDADLVKGCHFFGLVRIGKLEPYFLEFHNLRIPVGLYNSTICSCDFGDNVVVDNVNFIAHHIIGDETMLVNINELSTSPEAKFGNGIIKENEKEEKKIWLELCNENGGRKVLPFKDMLPGDAFLWSKYRDDQELMKKFEQFTENEFDKKPGYYGIIGHRCIIKNTKMIKDVEIGDDVYIKGANKLKNLTINSSPDAYTQIGEGCELVNGIIGYGCRIFYGVKAVRFIMADHSNLKYGARLINSYLGSNATISCCEVLNSLIFPSHEQHHNNSFLCAALIMGQSNMAAGATIGSNHNSRGADGEIVAGRGFWPGLCVSLKHNSRFASFTLITKGSYPAEINLSIPFSLLVNNEAENKLVVMPGYWFLYNMYALTRNSWKYPHRDHRIKKIQHIEYDYLAPDAVEEMFTSLSIMETAVGEALLKKEKSTKKHSPEEKKKVGKKLLLEKPEKIKSLTLFLKDVERSKRPTEIIKIAETYPLFKKMILYYGIHQIVNGFDQNIFKDFSHLKESIGNTSSYHWVNIGGQLMEAQDLAQLKKDIKSDNISNWKALHHRYELLGENYDKKKIFHAANALLRIKEISAAELSDSIFLNCLEEAKETAEWIQCKVEESREKDYDNPFRNMVYDNRKEMESVVGQFKEDVFIQHTQEQTKNFIRKIGEIKKGIK